METAYVVKVHNALPLTAPQPCFTFEHPNPHVETNSVDNSRYRTFTFKLDKAATIHGAPYIYLIYAP
jgi:protein arginine N-methyltransferase 5